MNAPAAPALEIPTAPGTPFAGGFYVGRFFLGADPYALIVAPKAVGELEGEWGPYKKRVDGALSYADGLANTRAMAEAGSGLAVGTLTLNIDGHGDWYLPSRLESLLLFGELSGAAVFMEKGAEAFEREWYWTSTQRAGDSSCAWIQSFNVGDQHYDVKDGAYRARAVRRIVIR